jgi:lipid-binding SYLF domain-containing protein
MFTLGHGSFGFQIGGEATDVVLIVMNAGGARKLVEDQVKLDGDISVAAGPVGLFAGVSLSGAVFKQNRDADRELHGRNVTAKEILIGADVRLPA